MVDKVMVGTLDEIKIFREYIAESLAGLEAKMSTSKVFMKIGAGAPPSTMFSSRTHISGSMLKPHSSFEEGLPGEEGRL